MVADLTPTDSAPPSRLVSIGSFVEPPAVSGFVVSERPRAFGILKVGHPSISRTICDLELFLRGLGNLVEGSMAGRPRRSCDSCNAQKVQTLVFCRHNRADSVPAQLRCGGEKPSCTRCTRLSRPCVYKPAGAAVVARRRPPSIASSHRPVPASEYPGSPSRLHIPEKKYFGVPSALLPRLVDLYFHYIYNARLLFYRPSLEAALEDQSVRADTLLCICALAAKYGSAVDPFNRPS